MSSLNELNIHLMRHLKWFYQKNKNFNEYINDLSELAVKLIDDPNYLWYIRYIIKNRDTFTEDKFLFNPPQI